MKKILAILFCITVFSQVQLKAQATDKPMNNFYVDPDKGNALIYQIVFSDTTDNLNVIAKKLRHYFAKSDFITDYTYDSVSAFVGHIKNIYINYYGKNKYLTGDFVIDIKDGKYKLVIRNMVWKSTTAQPVAYGYYGYGATAAVSETTLDESCLNKKGTKWESFASGVLPDLDKQFIKDFKLPADTKW
jgi:hypothetical protein